MLLADPEIRTIDGEEFTLLHVVERPGAPWRGRWVDDQVVTTHEIEVRFVLGANAAEILQKGDGVIVSGVERVGRTPSPEDRLMSRVIDADAIGVDLRWLRRW